MRHGKDPRYTPQEGVDLLVGLCKERPGLPPEFVELVQKLHNRSGTTSTDPAPTTTAPPSNNLISKEDLSKLDDDLRLSLQDYEAWHAIRRALSVVAPQELPFDRPAARILASFWGGKISSDGIRTRYVEPLAALGPPAIADLDWSLRFEGAPNIFHDRGRKELALQSLARIGGPDSAKAIRSYLHHIKLFQPNGKTPHPESYLAKSASQALLQVDPTDETLDEVSALLRRHPVSYEREMFFARVLRAPATEMATKTKLMLCKRVLTPPEEVFTWSESTSKTCIQALARIGGPEAGQILAGLLFIDPEVANLRRWWGCARNARSNAARALATVQDFDAVTPLVRAADTISDQSILAIVAWALGERGDPLAVPALQRIASIDEASAPLRTEAAAALIRLGVDYDRNAAIVRDALPDSLPRAVHLRDPQSVTAVAGYLYDKPRQRQAADVLAAIGTREALTALQKAAASGLDLDPNWLIYLNTAAARLSKTLGDPCEQQYAEVALVVETVLDWFKMWQTLGPLPGLRAPSATVMRHAELARKVWIKEVSRRLDRAANPDTAQYETDVPPQAIGAIMPMYSPELIPALERIVAEHPPMVVGDGKTERKSHPLRSFAAKLLTDKTGKPHTFIDVDGQPRPGGWGLENNPMYLYPPPRGPRPSPSTNPTSPPGRARPPRRTSR
ncbi:MAG: HEAT repeat domain-containing protein, partial [Phycisphaerae bacterium]|nr:HEAT repeat domain-containing protein [Phycisphaerae bacterium]